MNSRQDILDSLAEFQVSDESAALTDRHYGSQGEGAQLAEFYPGGRLSGKLGLTRGKAVDTVAVVSRPVNAQHADSARIQEGEVSDAVLALQFVEQRRRGVQEMRAAQGFERLLEGRVPDERPFDGGQRPSLLGQQPGEIAHRLFHDLPAVLVQSLSLLNHEHRAEAADEYKQ